MEHKTEKYEKLLSSVRQQFASVVWAHKIQEKQAEIYANNYNWCEFANILSASLTSCGIIGCFFREGMPLKIATAILSFITIFCASYIKSFDFKQQSADNKRAANELVVIRNKMLQVITDLHMMERDIQDIEGDVKTITQRLNKLYVEAPATTNKAVDAAKKALLVKKDYTFNDEEIDRFLPPKLRGGIKDGTEDEPEV